MSEIKIPQELLNVIADINFDEIQSQSYSPLHFRNWLCAWHVKMKMELYDFANNHELYQQGRADAIEEFRKFSYCKVCEEKGWNIYCDYCRVCQAQEYIAEQLKEQKNE